MDNCQKNLKMLEIIWLAKNNVPFPMWDVVSHLTWHLHSKPQIQRKTTKSKFSSNFTHTIKIWNIFFFKQNSLFIKIIKSLFKHLKLIFINFKYKIINILHIKVFKIKINNYVLKILIIKRTILITRFESFWEENVKY